MTPRMRIVWNVLEAARDADDRIILGACRRVIIDDRLGWRKYGKAEDLKLILAFDFEAAAMDSCRRG